MEATSTTHYGPSRTTCEVFRHKLEEYMTHGDAPCKEMREIHGFNAEHVLVYDVDPDMTICRLLPSPWDNGTIYTISDPRTGYYYGLRKMYDREQWVLYFEDLPDGGSKKDQYRLVMKSCLANSYQELKDKMEQLNVMRLNGYTGDLFEPPCWNVIFSAIMCCSTYVAGWYFDMLRMGTRHGLEPHTYRSAIVGLILAISLIFIAFGFLHHGRSNLFSMSIKYNLSEKITLESLRRHYQTITATFVGCEVIYLIGSILIDWSDATMQWNFYNTNIGHRIITPAAIMIVTILFGIQLENVMIRIMAKNNSELEGGANHDGSKISGSGSQEN